MKKNSLVAFLLIWKFSLLAQITNVEEKFNLPIILKESSGAIFFNDKLISHNDSGNNNVLYELDTISGAITRTITIVNATNVDWEDITQDDTSIYIGDIGNNNGDRTNLKIYRINKTDYLNANIVNAEIINFNYSDQTIFTPNPNNTVWDSEALINMDTSLILLTKNWVTGVTKSYAIPKNSGTYAVNPLTSTLSSGGLITGASYNPLTEKIYSIGYNSFLQPFIWISEGFSGIDIFSGTNTQISLTNLGFEQAEAITHIEPNRYFITSESFSTPPFSDDAKLISFSTNDAVLSAEEHPIHNVFIYPNPVQGMLTIDGIGFHSVEIYDLNARLVYYSENENVNIGHLNNGIYHVKINSTNSTYQIKKIIKN